MNPANVIDKFLFGENDSQVPLHHKKATLIGFTEDDKQSNVFRKASLKKYKLERYILNNSPKPVSRICIIKNAK